MINDITFCENKECDQKDCRRHFCNAPLHTCLSWSQFDGIIGSSCEYKLINIKNNEDSKTKCFRNEFK